VYLVLSCLIHAASWANAPRWGEGRSSPATPIYAPKGLGKPPCPVSGLASPEFGFPLSPTTSHTSSHTSHYLSECTDNGGWTSGDCTGWASGRLCAGAPQPGGPSTGISFVFPCSREDHDQTRATAGMGRTRGHGEWVPPLAIAATYLYLPSILHGPPFHSTTRGTGGTPRRK
jgi:hypothetical protein